MNLEDEAKNGESGNSLTTQTEERPHTQSTEGGQEQDDLVNKNANQLISEAYKTLSVLCKKLQPGKELDEDSFQTLDKLRSSFGEFTKNKSQPEPKESEESTESEKQEKDEAAKAKETDKQEMRCMYCSELAAKEYTCTDGTKLYACSAHFANAEKDATEKHGGIVSAVAMRQGEKATKQEGEESSNDDDVAKAGAKLSVTRRKAMKDAVEVLIALLKEVMPEEELAKWPVTRKVEKSSNEVRLEKSLSTAESEVIRLREELAKTRHSVAMSNVNIVEEIPTQKPQGRMEWPSDMNDLRE